MTDQGLEELAKSIALQGVIQPLLVRRSREKGKYQIIAGERRWRAAQLAHLSEVPVFLKDLSDEDVMLVALIENLQREDLNAAEEASALQELKDKLSITQEELARRLGKSRSMIANSLRLLQLPKDALTALREGRISAGHARCLLAFADHPEHVQGFLSYIPGFVLDFLPGQSYYVSTICVNRAHRRRGIASLLYDRVEQIARPGIVSLRTWSTNAAQIGALGRRGYVCVKRIVDDRGKGIDTVYFAKSLE